MALYFELMAESLEEAGWKCNDQATYIHLYYSGTLALKLDRHGLGVVELVSNEDAEHIGTVGTTPLVRINAGGETLSENGEVQAIVHQFKRHEKLKKNH
jgi:hypothetical protein